MRVVIRVPLMLAAMLALGCAEKAAPKRTPPPREVELLELAEAEVRDTGEYLGSLTSRQSVDVLPQVAGYVRKIHVRPGQRVASGAPLLEIDGRQESAALDSASAQQRSATAKLELARQTLARTETLYKEGLVSAQELERARAEAQAAEAALGAAGAQVAQRQVQLQYFVVRAPFSATVGDVLVRMGDFVGATTKLTSLAQSEVLEVSAAVPAHRARTLRPGAPLEVLDERGGVLVPTEVFFVAPEADPRTQLVEVKAVFANSVGLRPSEMVRVRVVYGTRRALQIPALAVVRQSGQAFAFAVRKEGEGLRVERRPIVLGALGRDSFVVEQGLKEGERIAISSIQALKDGATIKPLRPVAAAPTEAPDAGRAAD